MTQCDGYVDPDHITGLYCAAANHISVTRLRDAGALWHAELTGPQAYDYAGIVESYYCLQQRSWRGFWTMLPDHQFTFLASVLGCPAPAGTVPNPLLQMEVLGIIVIIILTIEVCIIFFF